MPVLTFTLTPDAVDRFNHSIACLGRFSEAVTIEARKDHLVLTTLNSTNSAYSAFTFAADHFFSKYTYNPPRTNGVAKEKFSCKMYNKALHSVFRGRSVDPLREKDTGISRCEVLVEDGTGEAKSRFVVKMFARHGVLKTYKLTFEAVAPAHAFFDSTVAPNRWMMSSRVLRDLIEHFGPGTEQLDICSDGGKVHFTSFTEKIMSGNEVLKQPLHTSIAIDVQDFSEFFVEEKMHIIISVRDFRAIIMHAGIINTYVTALYSTPQRPMHLKYTSEGLTSEFILMTIGDHRGSSVVPGSSSNRAAVNKGASRPLDYKRSEQGSMPPPSRLTVASASREPTRTSIARPSQTVHVSTQPNFDNASLFITDADDDRRWDPQDGDDGEEEEILGWDAGTDNGDNTRPYRPSLQDSGPATQSINAVSVRSGIADEQQHQLAPTQRLSQIRGMFDD